MSCWTATAHPAPNTAGLSVAIGSTRTAQVSHIDPTGRAVATAVLTTLSDPLSLHWSPHHRDLLWVGQRDGFVHLVDVRVPSVRSHLARAAAASIPPSVPVIPDTARTRGWIAQPTVPASPVSAIQSHGSDVNALHRDGSLRALLPGYGAVEIVRPCPGAERGETLLYPAVSRRAFETASADSDDFLDEFCNSVVGVHSNGFVFAQ
ncbi:hypothetical protein AMAG_06180 [Allomyces macrogynus ATCC 38327]|uniref:Uncharacterized protein n=1 Tax=Allomyces macrogynus (strain ATCC 38327) TaxID=578462 RepID=A0A0L0SFS4_ALLM3|nr:hypothetical protein AMAG_06180 [Allomyces macrogynus ATCC 38327]|eukprot:KNE61351.1 hypothetical protein AMAG_06180 [Allomyces macrogynus ATCC 38327]